MTDGGEVMPELGLDPKVLEGLVVRGHRIGKVSALGGYQAIWYQGPPVTGAAAGASEQPVPGVYRAASDHRKDGEAVGW